MKTFTFTIKDMKTLTMVNEVRDDWREYRFHSDVENFGEFVNDCLENDTVPVTTITVTAEQLPFFFPIFGEIVKENRSLAIVRILGKEIVGYMLFQDGGTYESSDEGIRTSSFYDSFRLISPETTEDEEEKELISNRLSIPIEKVEELLRNNRELW